MARKSSEERDPRVPELLEAGPGELEAEVATGGATVREPRTLDRSVAKRELRRQIARLERQLADTFVTAFPRRGIEVSGLGPAGGGPRMLGLAELERIRDGLALKLSDARAELGRRVDAEEANRGLRERMIADPQAYPWVRISNEDVGERGCGHYHSRPRWGILGMLVGWWRVKVSSGCPLATGRRLAAPALN